ncbi:MAG: hypothetical protein ABI411_05595 [Tahibacter sp.]
MRVAAALVGAVLLVASIGLPIATWWLSGSGAGWGTWVAVGIGAMLAAQCGRNLLRAASSGVGPRWNDPNSL